MNASHCRFSGILFIPIMLMNIAAYAQVIEKKEKIVIPVPPATSQIFTSGQNTTYRSWQEIEILPETDVQSGAELTFEVLNIATPPNEPAANLDMNWIISRKFDGNGNIAEELKSFYDRRGLLLQTQKKNLSARHVMATQTIYDALGRPAIKTLSAPILNQSFNYKSNFVTNGSGTAYNYKNFDDSKLNAPDPLGNTEAGTLGWYYSNNNLLEAYVPATGYPYSRMDYYDDGSGLVKRNAGIGEAFRMGQGHEVITYSVPAELELEHYRFVRKKFFPAAEVGEASGILADDASAEQIIKIDENGQQNIIIQDRSGNVLMTAKPGADLTATVYINRLSESSYKYYKIITAGIEGTTIALNGVRGNGYGEIYNIISSRGGTTKTLLYSGILNGYTKGIYGGTVSIESNEPFLLTYQFTNTLGEVEKCNHCSADASPAKVVGYFALLAPKAITGVDGTGGRRIYNMITGQDVTGQATLPAGYYRVTAERPGIMLSTSNSYGDISYNFYNQLGQLIGTIAPEGVKKLLVSGLSAFNSKTDLPFTTLYQYDLAARMISSQSQDRGRTEFVYKKNGKLRFLQNEEQRNRTVPAGYNKPYSYLNYDRWGRVVESGEIMPAVTGGIAFSVSSMSNVEDVSATGGLGAGTRKDVIKSTYDVPVITGVTGYDQEPLLLRNGLSYVEYTAGIYSDAAGTPRSRTWYNYDYEGRLSWLLREIPGLGKKAVHYTYDALDKVIKTVYQPNTPAETFVHYYEYDADQRLLAVYTNTADNPSTKALQAKYYYYLQGAVKRIELGGNLQGLDYTYTAQGLLKAINHGNRDMDPGKDGISGVNAGFAKDAFGINLEYYAGDYTRTGTSIGSIGLDASIAPDMYNGDIKAMSWHSRKPASVIASEGAAIENPVMYGFKYDSKYQISAAIWGSPNYAAGSFAASTAYAEKGLTYDLNGNIKTLARTNNTGALTDNFTYNYAPNSNKLQSVLNGSTTFDSYTYDELGQLETESPAGGPVRYLQYDAGGKVTGVFSDAGFTQPKVTYAYNELGQRVMKKDWVSNTVTYYVQDIRGSELAIYSQQGAATAVQSEIPLYASGRLGLYRRQTNIFEYELNDQLGNVLVTMDGSRNIKQYTDYYPFGFEMRRGGSADYRFGFQGQNSEKDKETGWNAFDLRMYDSRIGRWLSVDPKQQYASPYVAMGNNPVNKVDPDGGEDIKTGYVAPKNLWQRFLNSISGHQYMNKAYDFILEAGKTYEWVAPLYTDDAAYVYVPASYSRDGVATYIFTEKGYDFVGAFVTFVKSEWEVSYTPDPGEGRERNLTYSSIAGRGGEKLESWISKKLYGELRAISAELTDKFVQLIKRGNLVSHTGQAGIKVVNQKVNGVVYKYEAKIMGTSGSYRIYGNVEPWTKYAKDGSVKEVKQLIFWREFATK